MGLKLAIIYCIAIVANLTFLAGYPRILKSNYFKKFKD